MDQKLKEEIDQHHQAIEMERILTFREVMILLALEIGSYNEVGIGTSGHDSALMQETPESRLQALGLIHLNSDGQLEPTQMGRLCAAWFAGTLLDVVAPRLGSLLDR